MSKKKKHNKEKNKKPISLKNSVLYNCIGCFGDTNKGMVRANNEDAFVCKKIWGDNAVLAIAIDGLGGYEGGEEAARIAKNVIVDYIEASHNGDRIELLKQAVTSANNTIFQKSRDDNRYRRMGCVLTAIIVDLENKKVNMAHVGDSRLYCFHDGVLRKLSHDHSFVGFKEESGDLTEEQAMHHPYRNVVDRVVGHESHLASDKDFIEAEVFSLEPYTTYLLCSEGLTDMITSTSISGILEQSCCIKDKVDALIKAALEAGGKDNVTVVLVDYLEEKRNAGQGTHPYKQHKETTELDRDTDNRHCKPCIMAFVFLVLGFIIGYIVGGIL